MPELIDDLDPLRQNLALREELARRKKLRKIDTFYPEEGPLSRHNYPKHMEFFKAGAKYRERAFMAANRSGKTEGGGGYEMTLHLTGNYPHWWEGRRFNHPISAWMAGKTNETTRDIIQFKLAGPINNIGTGLIPGELINRKTMTKRQGISNAIDTIQVKHASGGWSDLGFKSYAQGRDGFEGTEKHVIELDEEPPEDVYSECLIRLMTVNGIIMVTFTPLEGITPVVLSFMPKGGNA